VGDRHLDLAGLRDFSFGPNWGSKPHKHEGERGRRGDFGAEGKRSWKDKGYSDREKRGKGSIRGGQEPAGRGERNFSRDRRERSGTRDNGRFPSERQEFIPIVEGSFYPDDAYFNTAIAALRLTCKTYELFNVARLFLESPERFAVVIKKAEAQDNKNLYMSVDDGFVFADEQNAIGHILAKHIEKYFDIVEEDVEAPKGVFVCIHRCGLTGKLLCPPNYHRYQEILIEHHGENFPRMSFQRFKENIESISDQSAIDEWKAGATKVKVYTPKTDEPGGRFTRFADVKGFFIENFKERALKVSDSFRMAGSTFNSMPRGILSKSIFVLFLREKKFPLGLSNNLRSKLRREKFTIYKIGASSKITYVCAAKRKFRSAEDRFEDNIQSIIDCIDANPNNKPVDIYRKLYPEAAVPDDAFSEKDGILSAFVKNLNWLLREGYVAEFEDGRLVATAIISKEQLEAMNKPEIRPILTGESEISGPAAAEQIPPAEEQIQE
jgi:hypothetical protein